MKHLLTSIRFAFTRFNLKGAKILHDLSKGAKNLHDLTRFENLSFFKKKKDDLIEKVMNLCYNIQGD